VAHARMVTGFCLSGEYWGGGVFACRRGVVGGDGAYGWGAGFACGVGEAGEEFEGRIGDNFKKLFRPILLNWRMAKSFYDLDYIIDISEKRLAEYTVLYQKVLERLTNVILIYSALGIFLTPLVQHAITTDIKGVVYYLFLLLFIGLLSASIVYFIKLLLPAGIAYLDPPKKYYGTFREQLEGIYAQDKETVDESLKASYILDLEEAIHVNGDTFKRKNSFFNNALVFALLAVVPYIVCLGFHLSKK
jgi:hypothetical protein